MERRQTGSPLFWLGLIGLVLTCLYAVYLGPNAARKLEGEVQTAAQSALRTGGDGWVTAEADGQKIILAGVATSEAQKTAAVERVMRAIGPGGVVQGGVTKVLTSRVDVAPPTSPYAWGAQKEGDAIVLAGVAPTRASIAAITGAGKALYGDRVINQMTLGSGAPEGVNWELTATLGLEAIKDLSPGAAELVGDRLVITGAAASDDIVASVDNILGRAGPRVEAVSQVFGPAEWMAQLSAGEISFTGRVADEGLRTRLARAAAVGARDVKDEAEIGETGNWGARVITAMPHFAKFRSGQMTARAGLVRISGEATESVLDQLREDMSALVDGSSVQYNVKPVAPELGEIAGIDLSSGAADRAASCQEAFTRIMAGNKILFGTGDARISRESGLTLDKLVEVSRQCGEYRIEVQGHTDNQGGRAANLRLSRARAEAVRAYLQDKGFPADRLTAAGLGPDQPTATNANERGRAQNRRIEFKISTMESR